MSDTPAVEICDLAGRLTRARVEFAGRVTVRSRFCGESVLIWAVDGRLVRLSTTDGAFQVYAAPR